MTISRHQAPDAACELRLRGWACLDLNQGPLPYQSVGELAQEAIPGLWPGTLALYGLLPILHCPAFTRVVLSALGPL
jgi:hypothetical protein